MSLLHVANRLRVSVSVHAGHAAVRAFTPSQGAPALAPSFRSLGRQRAGMTTTTSATAEKADPTQKQDWTTEDMPSSLEGKVFIMTGGSDGLGKVSARDIAAKGGHVIIASRNLQKCEDTAEEFKAAGVAGKVTPMHLDLASFKSVVAFAEAFKAKNLPLNVLVGNAGVFLIPHDHTEEGFEITIGTNYYGHFLLFHLLLDKLKESSPSRIVFMASLIEQLGKVPWHNMKQTDSKESDLFEYANSKIMTIMLSREMNKRLKGQGVECFTANPGIVNTPLNGPKLDHSKLTGNLMDITASLAGQTTEAASICLTRPATDPALEGYGGSYFSSPYLSMLPIHVDHAAFQEPKNDLARDQDAMKRLYDESLKVVNEALQSKGLEPLAGI